MAFAFGNFDMITREKLLAAGYKQFQDVFKKADCAYQKRVGHTRYFINVYEYDWTDVPNIPFPVSYEVDCQFQDYDDQYLNISFAVTNSDSVEQFEARVEDIFTRLGCQDYE